jgi:hypothetical protein
MAKPAFFRPKARDFNLKARAFEPKARAFELKSRVFGLKARALESKVQSSARQRYVFPLARLWVMQNSWGPSVLLRTDLSIAKGRSAGVSADPT